MSGRTISPRWWAGDVSGAGGASVSIGASPALATQHEGEMMLIKQTTTTSEEPNKSDGSERTLVTTSLRIGVDQREALRDLARDAQRENGIERFDISILVRAAIDAWLETEHRRRAQAAEEEKRRRTASLDRQIEALAEQLRALSAQRDSMLGEETAPTVAMQQAPLPLPTQKRRGPLEGRRVNATRDILFLLLREKKAAPTSTIARDLYGRPGIINERKTQKRLRALERAEQVIRMKRESAEGHGLAWKLTRAGEVIAREMLQASTSKPEE